MFQENVKEVEYFTFLIVNMEADKNYQAELNYNRVRV